MKNLLLIALSIGLPALALGQAQQPPPKPPKPPIQSTGPTPATPSSAATGAALPAALARGILEEEGNLNLRGAIKQYEAVIADFDTQRRYAATPCSASASVIGN